MMTPENKTKLFAIVRTAIAEGSVARVQRAIYDCHNGRLDGWIVTQDNLHLFRQYRNNVSGDPARLTNEALEAV
jgi:hypothetical protein